MFSHIFAYIKFLSKSKNHHGVHSPFVFDLLTKCLYTKNTPAGFQRWIEYRNTLKQNKSLIEVTDFGAGSKVFRSNQRQIAKMAKHVGISRKRARLLYKMMEFFQYDHVLEMGTSLGLGTCAISLGNPKANITTLEGCPETAKVAETMFQKRGLNSIEVVIGDFKETYPKALKNQQFDCIYFDGNHSKEATINYFETCLPHVHNDSLLIFDDIHWSTGMEEAWQYIQNHPQVTVSIDTFQWGLVFFRKEQQKEHFIVRV